MNEMCAIARRQRDIGIVLNLLNEGKSKAEVYEEFKTRYNRRKDNPHWKNEAPDVVFADILESIEAAIEPAKERLKKLEERLKELK